MRFMNLSVLVFLVVPLVAAVVMTTAVFLRRRMLQRIGNRATVEQQLRRPSPYLRAASGIFLVLGLSGLVMAAARPQYGGRVQMLKKRGVDIVVALDFSKSMLAQDVLPSRIERAKMELSHFITHLTGDRVGLVAFSGDTLRFPLTTDYRAATSFWSNLGPYDMPVGGTAIGRALTAALETLLDSRSSGEEAAVARRSRVIILLTDGEDHYGTPLEVAREAATKDVRIYTVGIGSDSPELIPRYLKDGKPMGYQMDRDGNYVTTALTAENEDVLRQIAATTGGRYFRAGSDLSGLTAVVDDIRNMKQTELESRQAVVYEEVFQWFLLPAGLFLLLAYLLPERRRKGYGR